MLKNMTMGDAVKSKAMWGGVFLLGVGAFMIYKGDNNMGMMAIGNALGIMGIRDAK